MKKFRAIIMLLMMFLLLGAIAVASDYYMGDANGDGVVDLKDVTALRRYIVGGYGIRIYEPASDLNGDGKISLKDVTVLRRYLAGGYGVELHN